MGKTNETDCLVCRKHHGEISLPDLLSQLGLCLALIYMYEVFSTRPQVISMY